MCLPFLCFNPAQMPVQMQVQASPASASASVPTSAGSLEEQIRNYFRENGNKQTPVKQLMKYITKKDRNFQAIKDVKVQGTGW